MVADPRLDGAGGQGEVDRHGEEIDLGDACKLAGERGFGRQAVACIGKSDTGAGVMAGEADVGAWFHVLGDLKERPNGLRSVGIDHRIAPVGKRLADGNKRWTLQEHHRCVARRSHQIQRAHREPRTQGNRRTGGISGHDEGASQPRADRRAHAHPAPRRRGRGGQQWGKEVFNASE